MSGEMKLICPSGETGQKISSKVHFPLFLIMVQLINVFRHCTYTVYLFNTMRVTTRKGVRVTAFNATFNNISSSYFVTVSFISKGKRSTTEYKIRSVFKFHFQTNSQNNFDLIYFFLFLNKLVGN